MFRIIVPNSIVRESDSRFTFSIAPTRTLDADKTITWEIVFQGFLPANDSYFDSITGTLDFRDGDLTTDSQPVAINLTGNAVGSFTKNFAVVISEGGRINDGGTEIDTTELTLTDDDGRASVGDVNFVGISTKNILGAVTTSDGTYSGAGGHDEYVITRYQHGDVTINDTFGANVIKFDYGTTITHYDETARTIRGETRASNIVLTLDTGATVTIASPSGSYSYQIGDGDVRTYTQFREDIGITVSNALTTLSTPFVVQAGSDVATGVVKGTTSTNLLGVGDEDIIGASTDSKVTLSGAGGDDIYVITRHQYGDVTINDTFGANVIKFDYGTTITHYDETARTIRGETRASNIVLTLDTGATVTIASPSGKYSYQIGDGDVRTYTQFRGDIGITVSNALTTLSTPYTVDFPSDEPVEPPPTPDGVGADPVAININDNASATDFTPAFASGTDGTGHLYLSDDASGKNVSFTIPNESLGVTEEEKSLLGGVQFNRKVAVTGEDGTVYGTLFFFKAATYNSSDTRYETDYAFLINNEGVNSRALADGLLTLPISVTAAIDGGSSSNFTFNINITPGDDPSEFDTTTESGHSAEGAVEEDRSLTITDQTIGFSDPDSTADSISLTATATQGGASDTIDASGGTVKTTYGEFTFTRAHATNNKSGTITWNYTLDQNTPAVDALIATGDPQEDKITITDSNGNPTEITVRITGTNDPLAFDVDTGEDAGEVTEDATDPNNKATGTIYFNDPDSDSPANSSRDLTASVTLPDGTTSQPIASSLTTAYGTIEFTRTDNEGGRGSSITWTYTLDDKRDDIIPAAGGMETITLAIVSNIITLASQDIVITVNGVEDDLTFDTTTQNNHSASGAVTEDSQRNTAASQTIGFSDADTDVTGITLEVLQGGTPKEIGTETTFTTDYGTFTIRRADADNRGGTLTWDYELGVFDPSTGDFAEVDKLAPGAENAHTDTITIRNEDNHNEFTTISVTITGTEDSVNFVEPSDSALYEGAVEEDVTESVTKTITFNDPDTPNRDIDNLKAYVMVSDSEISEDIGSGRNELRGQYGTMVLNRTDGADSSSIQWTYTLDDAVPATATEERFTLRFGEDMAGERQIVISITAHESETMFTTSGSADGTTFSNMSALVEDSNTYTAMGVIGFADNDSPLADIMFTVRATASEASERREITNITPGAKLETPYGTLTFTGRDDINGRLTWSYELKDKDATDALRGGQTDISDVITIISSGGGDETITIDLTGADDPLEFDTTRFGTSVAGAVTESTRKEPNADDVIAGRTTGRIFFVDPDTDLSTIALNISGAQYGTLSIIERNDRTGELVWQYELNNELTEVNGLDGVLPSAPTGELDPTSLTDRISITGSGGVRQDITITITGANDSPRLESGVFSAAITENIAAATFTTNFNTVYQRLNAEPFTISFSDPDTRNEHNIFNEEISVAVGSFDRIVSGNSENLFGSGQTPGIFIHTTYGLIHVLRTDNEQNTGTGTLKWTYYLRHGVIENGVIKRDTILDVGSEALPSVTDSIYLSISDKNRHRPDHIDERPDFEDTIEITITGINDAPTLTQATSQQTLKTNTRYSGGDSTGITFTVTDPDRDTVFTKESFTVRQGDFTKIPSRDYEVVNKNPDPNGEKIWTLVYQTLPGTTPFSAGSTHSLEVQVTDDSGLASAVLPITINFTDDTPPEFESDSGSVRVGEFLQSATGTIDFSDDLTPRAELILRVDDGTADGVETLDLQTIPIDVGGMPTSIDISAYGNANYGKFELTRRENDADGQGEGRIFWRYTLDAERAKAIAQGEVVTESIGLFIQDLVDGTGDKAGEMVPGNKTTGSIIVNVTGVNDAPEIMLHAEREINGIAVGPTTTKLGENRINFFENGTHITATITDPDTDRDDLILRVYEVDSEGTRTISKRFDLVRDIYYSRNPGENDFIVILKPADERRNEIFNHEDPYNTGTLDHSLNGVITLQLEVDDGVGGVVTSTETISVTIVDLPENAIPNPDIMPGELDETFAEGEEINFVFRQDAFIDEDETNSPSTVTYKAEFMEPNRFFALAEIGRRPDMGADQDGQWLYFDPDTQTFSGEGTQAQIGQSFLVRVIRKEVRTDNMREHYTHQDFFITISNVEIPPVPATGADTPSFALTIAEPDPASTPETTQEIITEEHLLFMDTDTPSASNIRYVITEAPTTNGVKIHLNNTELGLGDSFTQDDINEDRVSIVKDGSEPSGDTTFKFRVDNKSSGAVDPALTEHTFTITVTAFNDPFVITNISSSPDTRPSVNEDGSLAITNAHLSVTDEEQTIPASIIYTITDLPDHGILRISGIIPVLGNNDWFTQANLVAGDVVTYTPDNDPAEKDVRSDAFSFTIGDSLGNPESATQTFRIDINNNVPERPIMKLHNSGGEINRDATITHSIDENSPAGNIGIRLESFDPDLGENLGANSFTVFEGDNRQSASSRFGVRLDGTELQLQLLENAEVNHENPDNAVVNHDADGRIDLTIRLSDGFLNDDATIQLTIVDVPEDPSVAFLTAKINGTETTSATLGEGTPAGVEVRELFILASDEDENDNLVAASHFQVLEDGSTSTRFQVRQLAGDIGTNFYRLVYDPAGLNGQRLDYETEADRTVALTIRVTDPGGTNTTSDYSVTITLTDADDNDLVFDTTGNTNSGAINEGDATPTDNQTIGFSDRDSVTDVANTVFTATEDARVGVGMPSTADIDSTGGSIDTDYGTFTFMRMNTPATNSGTLTWYYELNNEADTVKKLTEGAPHDDIVTLTGAKGSVDISVRITGINNTPMIDPSEGDGSFDEESNTQTRTGITLTVTDDDTDVTDLADTAFTVTEVGRVEASRFGVTNRNGMADGVYEVVLLAGNGADFDYETLTDEEKTIQLRITVNDGSGDPNAVSDGVQVTVNVEDVDDTLLTFTPVSGGNAGAITEDVTTPISGDINFEDPDTDDIKLTATSRSSSESTIGDNITSGTTLNTTYGIITFTRDDSTGALTWSYALQNNRDAVQALKSANEVMDIFDINTGHDTATQEVTITLSGAQDAPKVVTGGLASENFRVTQGQSDYTYEILASNFADPDGGENPKIVAIVSSLPSWLSFDMGTQTFSTNTAVPSDATSFMVTVTIGTDDPSTGRADIDIPFTVLTGENDPADFTQAQTDGVYTLDTNEDATGRSTPKKRIEFDDPDSGDPEANVTIEARDKDAMPQNIISGAIVEGKYGIFRFARSNSQDNAYIEWDYELTQNFDYLTPNSEAQVDSIVLTIKDRHDVAGAPRTLTVNIAGVNDLPEATPDEDLAVVNNTFSLTFTEAMFDADDVDGDNNVIKFNIKSGGLRHGEIHLNDSPISGNSFTLADVIAGSVKYVSAGTTEIEDTFRFTLSDASGQESTPYEYDITINQAPELDLVITDGEVEEDSLANNTANGTITLSDPNSGDTLTFTAGGTEITLGGGEQDIVRIYGTFYFERTSATNITWRYELNNMDEDTQRLTTAGGTETIALAVSDEGADSTIDDELTDGADLNIRIIGKEEVTPTLTLEGESEIELAARMATTQQDLGVTFTVADATPTEDDFEVYEGDPATTPQSTRFDVRNNGGVWTLELDPTLPGFDAPDANEVIELRILVQSAGRIVESDPVQVRVNVTGRDTGDAVYVLSTSATSHVAPVAKDLTTDGNTTLYALRPSDGDDPDGHRGEPTDYQWFRVASDGNISNPKHRVAITNDGSSYTLTAADAGHRVGVTVSYEDGIGTDEIVTTQEGVIVPDPMGTFDLVRPVDVLYISTIYQDEGARIVGEAFTTTHPADQSETADPSVTFDVFRTGFPSNQTNVLPEYTHKVYVYIGQLHYHNKTGANVLVLNDNADDEVTSALTVTVTATRDGATSARSFTFRKIDEPIPDLQDSVITFTDTAELDTSIASAQQTFEFIDLQGNTLTYESTGGPFGSRVNDVDIDTRANFSLGSGVSPKPGYHHQVAILDDGTTIYGRVDYIRATGQHVVELNQDGLDLLNSLTADDDPIQLFTANFRLRIESNFSHTLHGESFARVVVNLVGVNDRPILDGDGVVNAEFALGSGEQLFSVNSSFRDVDRGDSVTLTREYEQSPGVWVGFDSLPTGFSFANDELVIDTDTAGAGDYNFRISATDSHGLAAEDTDTFTITLSDALIITPASTTYADTADDDRFTPIEGAMRYLGLAGTFSVTGVEGTTTLTTETAPESENYSHKIVGTYGTLYYDQTGTNNYIFVANDAAIEALKSGQITSTYTFAHTGTTQTQDITLTFTGTNDAPEQVGTPSLVTIAEYTSEIIRIPNDLFADRDDANLTISYQLLDSDGRAFSQGDQGTEPAWFSYGLIISSSQQAYYGFTIQSPIVDQDTNYTIRLTARDTQGATATADINLTITNQDRPAGADPSNDAIYVISSESTSIRSIPTPADLRTNDFIYAHLLDDDPDGDVTGATYRWLREGTPIIKTRTLNPNYDPETYDFNDPSTHQYLVTYYDSPSYQITEDDLGTNLSVAVTYTETGGAVRVVTSNDAYIPDPNGFSARDEDGLYVREAATIAGETSTADTATIQTGVDRVIDDRGTPRDPTDDIIISETPIYETITNLSATTTGSVTIIDQTNDYGTLTITLSNAPGDDDNVILTPTAMNPQGEFRINGVNGYGAFVFTRDDEAGRLNWEFTLDNTNTNALSENEVATETISIIIGRGAHSRTIEASLVNVIGANDAPINIATDFRYVAGAQMQLSLQDVFTDPEGDTITYTLTGQPSWLTLDASRGELVINNPTTAGDFTATLRATDSHGAHTNATLNFEIMSTQGLNQPMLTSPTPNFTALVFDSAADEEPFLIPGIVLTSDTLDLAPGASIVVYKGELALDNEGMLATQTITPTTNAGFNIYRHDAGALYYNPTTHVYYYQPTTQPDIGGAGGEDVFVIFRNATEAAAAISEFVTNGRYSSITKPNPYQRLAFSSEENTFYDDSLPFGTFTATDADSDAVIFEVTGSGGISSVIDTSHGFTHSIEGNYGTLHYHRDGGQWVYIYDDRAESAVADETLSEVVFTVRAIDEVGYASTPRTITVDITGAEDRPEIDGGSAGRVGNRPIDANDRSPRSGTIEINNLTDRDDDDADAIAAGILAPAESGYINFWTGTNDFSLQAGTPKANPMPDEDPYTWSTVDESTPFSIDLTYGSFTLNNLGAWTYTLGTTQAQETALQAIAFGDTAQEALTIRFVDTDGGFPLYSNAATVIASINGVNDSAEFAPETTGASAVVTPTATSTVGPTTTRTPGTDYNTNEALTRIVTTTTTTTKDRATYTYNSGDEDEVIVEVNTTSTRKETITTFDYTNPDTTDTTTTRISKTDVGTFAVTGSVTKNSNPEISGVIRFEDLDGFNGITDNSHIRIMVGTTAINEGTNAPIGTTYGDITFTRTNGTGTLQWSYALDSEKQALREHTEGTSPDEIRLRITDGELGGFFDDPIYGTDATITLTVNGGPNPADSIEPSDTSDLTPLYEQDPTDATRSGTLEFRNNLGNKIEGDDVTWGMTEGQPPGVYTGSAGGTLRIEANGSYTYERPDSLSPAINSGGTATDTFTIMAHERDNEGNSVTDTIDFTIKGLSDVNGDGAVNDPLNGADDTDELIQGGNLGDTIDTGSGRDVVVGGYGADTITLGAGQKTIIHRFASLDGVNAWQNDDGRDTIKEFKHGEDKLVLVDTDTISAISLSDLISDTSASSGLVLRVTFDDQNDKHISGFSIGFGTKGIGDSSDDDAGRFFEVQYATSIEAFASTSTPQAPVYTADGEKLLGANGAGFNGSTGLLTDYSLIENYFGDDNLNVIALSDLDITIL